MTLPPNPAAAASRRRSRAETLWATLGRRGRLAGAAAAATLLSSAAVAQNPVAERGHRLVQEWCGECHAVERFGDSPLAIAPPFRTLHERYPVSDLEEALVEGIITGHPTMPEFSFHPADAEAIIRYLETLP